MNSEVKALWLAALESGEYKQCKGALKGKDENGQWGYCCLGVLDDIYAKQTGKGKWKDEGTIAEFDDGEGNDNIVPRTGYPTTRIYEWAGLSHEDGANLADINDTSEDFSKVIEVIKEKY